MMVTFKFTLMKRELNNQLGWGHQLARGFGKWWWSVSQWVRQLFEILMILEIVVLFRNPSRSHTPPPGASAEGVGQGRCSRVLFNSADPTRKKLITKLNDLFYVFIPHPTYNTPKMMASRFPHASHSSYISSMLPSVAAWLLYFGLPIGRQ